MTLKTLKYYTNQGWKTLYNDVLSYLFNNALLRGNNLSDLVDKEAARESLELTGDNNHTHYHDDHYLPIIQSIEDKVDQKLDEFRIELDEKDILSNFEGDITNISNMKNGWYKWTGTIDGITGVWIIAKIFTLYTVTSVNDPRIVLSSNDLTTWYSPYGYWHA